MPTKEKVKEWREDLRALLDTADGMLAQLKEGDGLFFCSKGEEEEYDQRYGKYFTRYGLDQTLFRVTKVERAKNSALRLAFAKPLNIHPRIRIPVLKATVLCGRFVPQYGDAPPLLSYDPRQAGVETRNLVHYKAYHHIDAPAPTLVVGVDLFDLPAPQDKVFDSVEALQGVIDQYAHRVVARVRPGEVKVLLTDSILGER